MWAHPSYVLSIYTLLYLCVLGSSYAFHSMNPMRKIGVVEIQNFKNTAFLLPNQKQDWSSKRTLTSSRRIFQGTIANSIQMRMNSNNNDDTTNNDKVDENNQNVDNEESTTIAVTSSSSDDNDNDDDAITKNNNNNNSSDSKDTTRSSSWIGEALFYVSSAAFQAAGIYFGCGIILNAFGYGYRIDNFHIVIEPMQQFRAENQFNREIQKSMKEGTTTTTTTKPQSIISNPTNLE